MLVFTAYLYNNTNGGDSDNNYNQTEADSSSNDESPGTACLLTRRLVDPLTPAIRLGIVIQEVVTHPTTLTASVKGRTHITQIRW